MRSAALRALVLLCLIPATPCQVACGDCDLNGSLSILDALVSAQLSAGILVPTQEQECACDVDSSLTITIVDALRLAQEAAGMAVGLTCIQNPCGTGLVESFTDTVRMDPTSTALWNDPASPGVLTGTPTGGSPTLNIGSGSGGSLSLASGPHTIDTDAGTIDGSPSAGWNPGPGEFHFTDVAIQAGADVQVQGSVPLILRSTGAVTIDGVLDGSGGAGGDGDQLGQPGGAAGQGRAGGSDGGAGDPAGGTGAPGDSPVGVGLGGEGGAGTDGALCLAGTGPCLAVAGAGGSFGSEGGAGFDYEGLGRVTIPNPTYGNPPYLDPVVGGSGGGGGGGIFGGAVWGGQSDSTGAGGGAGGGAIQVAAGGLLTVNGRIDVSGGGGGQAGALFWCAAGGGGSGGAIKLESLVDVALGATAELLAAGGPGGSNYSQWDIFAGLPRDPFTDLEQDNPNVGGDGGAGRIVLRDADGVITGLGYCDPAPDVQTLGALTPGGGAGGSWTLPEESAASIDTDTGEIDTGMGPSVSPGFVGGGVFEFTDIDMGEGAYLVVLGTTPLTLRTTGDATLRGLIEITGLPGFPGSAVLNAPPTPLGFGGGGDAGDAGSAAPDPGPWAGTSGGGPGGGEQGDGVFTVTPGPPPDTIGCSGGGAGHATPGTDAGSVVCAAAPIGVGGTTYGSSGGGEAGSGGGGGGGSTVLGDGALAGNSGGTGGPGGGTLVVECGGQLSFRARVRVDGSRGGNTSFPVSTFNGMAGSGGGGSGGSVLLKGGTGLQFQGSITATGGERGTVRDTAGAPAAPCSGIVLDAGDGGDGGAGFIRLEDPTGSITPAPAVVEGSLSVHFLPGGGCQIQVGRSLYVDSGLAAPDYNPPTITATPAGPGMPGGGGEMWTVVYHGADDALGAGEIGPFSDINQIDGKPFFRFEFTLTSCAAAPVIDEIQFSWQ